MPRPEDPGKGARTREERRALRKAAWEPKNAAKRNAHKAAVLAALNEERELLPIRGGGGAKP